MSNLLSRSLSTTPALTDEIYTVSNPNTAPADNRVALSSILALFETQLPPAVDAVTYVSQSLTSAQKSVARNNIGIVTVHVEDYGAVGNGITNDSTAIQNAINAVSAAGGGVIQFGAKVYLCSGLTIPITTGSNGGVSLIGVPQAKLTITPSPSTLTAPYTILRQPQTGGVTLTINGTSGTQEVKFTKIEYINFQGYANAGTAGYTSIGLQCGQYCVWTDVRCCSFQFFGDQGLWMGGIAYEVEGCFCGYNLRTQPRTRISGSAEFYGSDGMVTQNEINGQQSSELTLSAPLSNGDFPSRAILVQSANSFYSSNVGEFGDVGITLVGLLNASDPLGFSWPDSCTENTFTACRADHNKGNGWELLIRNGGSPNDNKFMGSWADNNGLDTTTKRSNLYAASNPTTNATSMTSGTRYQIDSIGTTDFTQVGAASNTVGLYFTATGAGTGSGIVYNTVTTSEAGFLIFGQRNVFMGCGSASSAVTANVVNGFFELSTSSIDASSYNRIIGQVVVSGSSVLGAVRSGIPVSSGYSLSGAISDMTDTAIVQRLPTGSGTNPVSALIDATNATTIRCGSNPTSGYDTITGLSLQFARFGSKLRFISGNGKEVISYYNSSTNASAPVWSNGRLRRFASQHQAADLFQMNGVWYEPGPPKLSFVSTSQSFSSIANGASVSFTVSATQQVGGTSVAASIGDLVSVAPNQSIAGCFVTGTVTSSGTVTVVVANMTGSAQTPTNGTFNVEVELW